MGNIVRPAAFKQREEDLRRGETLDSYRKDSEDRIARRVVELLKEEGLVVWSATTP